MPSLPSRKRRKLSPIHSHENGSVSLETTATPIVVDDFWQGAAKWDLEQDYEQRPRRQKKQKENLRLPIKTAEGKLAHVELSALEDSASEEDGNEKPMEERDRKSEEAVKEVQAIPSTLSRREQIFQAKEELAKLAGLMNESPEEHISSLRRLVELTASTVPSITKLGLVTQLAVYKDIIPGYRIRPLSEQDMNVKLSKEVRNLRNFEQSVVRRYQDYVNQLARTASLSNNSTDEDVTSSASVAISCACDLLTTVYHFNFRSELLKIIVHKLSRNLQDKDSAKCIDALSVLFANDDEGNASMEAVALLSKMFKARDYRIDQNVLNTFLRLRLLTEFSKKASTTSVDKDAEANPSGAKKMDKNKPYRSKKQRKLDRERKSIAKEMEEADAAVSHENRDQLQAETLKIVFSTYFRILKAKAPGLKAAVLEGLVKYSHLINQDFFGDIIESLRELLADSESHGITEDDATAEQDQDPKSNEDNRNITRESLLCIITAFALLQGQEGVTELNLDLNFFTSHLYGVLYPASLDADIELSSKSIHLQDSDYSSARRPVVDVQTTIVLLIRSLNAVLLPANARSVPPVRLAAFVKQLMTISMNLPEKSCRAVLGLLNQVARAHRKRIGALWHSEERRGDGVFDPLRAELEGSNPFASTVWEGELLKLHYSSDIRDAAKNLESAVMY